MNKIERDSRTGSIFLSSPDNQSTDGKQNHSGRNKKSGIGRRATITLNAMKHKFFNTIKDTDDVDDGNFKLARKNAVKDISAGVAKSQLLEQQELIVDLLILLENKGIGDSNNRAFQSELSKLRSRAEIMHDSFRILGD